MQVCIPNKTRNRELTFFLQILGNAAGKRGEGGGGVGDGEEDDGGGDGDSPPPTPGIYRHLYDILINLIFVLF